MPGEEIALSLDCPEGTVTDIQWIINEKAFKNYIANNNQGVLILIDQAERHAPSVTFYWANTGDGRVVECQFKLDGEWCTASATLNVKTPIVTFNTGYNPPPMGTIQLNAANDRVGLYPEPGIVFDAKVEVPTGFANGSWQYVQLVLPNTTVKISATGICKSRRSNDLVLDTQYPYDGPWATGAMLQNTDDSPGGPLPANFSQRNGNHQILMYIMFRPSGENSQWVPVRKVLWKVNWCCTNNSGTWSLDESGQSTGSWLTTSDHPQWKANVINLPTIDVPCPPPCNP